MGPHAQEVLVESSVLSQQLNERFPPKKPMRLLAPGLGWHTVHSITLLLCTIKFFILHEHEHYSTVTFRIFRLVAVTTAHPRFGYDCVYFSYPYWLPTPDTALSLPRPIGLAGSNHLATATTALL